MLPCARTCDRRNPTDFPDALPIGYRPFLSANVVPPDIAEGGSDCKGAVSPAEEGEACIADGLTEAERVVRDLDVIC